MNVRIRPLGGGLLAVAVLLVVAACSPDYAPLPFDAARQPGRLAELQADNAAEPVELDRFGGWANAPAQFDGLTPGPFFRVEQVDGAWWFVTPDGNPMFSKGATDVNWLGANLADDDLHQVLVTKYGDESTWASATHDRLDDWGFNTVGPWSSGSAVTGRTHGHVILDLASVRSPRYPGTKVTDYWSPTWVQYARDLMANQWAPYANDPYLLGYFLDNELIWGADHFNSTGVSLLQHYIGFPSGSPGRNAAIDFLRQTAGSLAVFNSTWGTGFTNWDQLATLNPLQLIPSGPAAVAVTDGFMLATFEQYATVAVDAVRRVDPNHLIFGPRFHHYPGDILFQAAAEHFEVVAMAAYAPDAWLDDLDAITQEVDVPVLVEEFSFKGLDSGYWNIKNWAPRVMTQADRALAYDRFVETFSRRPYAVGYHWYKWMDNPYRGSDGFSGDNFGLLRPDDTQYTTFTEHVAQVNRRVENWHHTG